MAAPVNIHLYEFGRILIRPVLYCKLIEQSQQAVFPADILRNSLYALQETVLYMCGTGLFARVLC